jgi:hypothetical protein
MARLIGVSQSQSYLGIMGSQSGESLTTAPLSATIHSSNVSIGTDRPVSTPRKVQLKQTSFLITRAPSTALDAESILGGRTYDVPPSPPKRNNSIYRAAEKGRGELLPTASSMAPSRGRSSSSSNESKWGSLGSLTRTESASRSLRSRGRRSSHDHAIDSSSSHRPAMAWSYSASHDKPPLRGYKESRNFPDLKNTNFIQMLAVLVLTCLVWESYHRAISTTEQFEKLKHDESILMLHLQRIEQQSIQVHENLSRLNDGTVVVQGMPGSPKDSEPIDAKLIHVQTQQLYQMEEELNHELRGLQSKLQHVARGSIVSAFGEGPVQVSFELDFGAQATDSTERISISLWYDTPYAAWTLIDQVQKGVWTGSKFSFDKGLSLIAAPPNPDPTAKLDFVEKSQKSHEAWTVGLTENEAGGMSLFINLQDNSANRKHDVCVGKIVEGFGTLQKLVDSTRRLEGKDKFVSIKVATASRLSVKTKPKGHGPFD